MPVPYIDKINQRLIGSEQQIFSESHQIGTTALNTVTPDTIRLVEIPLLETPSSVAIPGFSEVTTLPGTNEFSVDYTNGRILFNSSRNGEFVVVDYKGRGSIIDAEDVNEIQQVFVGSVTPGSPTIGIASLDGTLSAGIVRPSNISTVPTDDFSFLRDVQVGRDLTVIGNLDVQGTLTTLQTETVTIDDNKLLLNSNVTGAPTEDSGIEIERGSSTNVELIWNETNDSWQLVGTAGVLLEAFDSGLWSAPTQVSIGTNATEALRIDANQNVSIGTGFAPAAKFHNSGSTVFGITTDSDPASIPVATVDNFTGINITTTVSTSVTLPTPTNTTAGRFFTVLHNDTSGSTLNVDGSNIGAGKGSTFMWDSTAWIPVGATGGFELLTVDPVSPVTADVWFNDTDKQFKGYNGSEIIILG